MVVVCVGVAETASSRTKLTSSSPITVIGRQKALTNGVSLLFILIHGLVELTDDKNLSRNPALYKACVEPLALKSSSTYRSRKPRPWVPSHERLLGLMDLRLIVIPHNRLVSKLNDSQECNNINYTLM